MAERLEGKYIARADNWKYEETGTGKIALVINWKLTINERESRYAYLEQRLYFTEASFDISIRTLRNLGWTGEDLQDLANRAGGLDREEVEVEIEVEAPRKNPETGALYQERSRVKWVNRLGPKKTALSTDQLRSWSAGLKDAVKASRERLASKDRTPPVPSGLSAVKSSAVSSSRPVTETGSYFQNSADKNRSEEEPPF